MKARCGLMSPRNNFPRGHVGVIRPAVTCDSLFHIYPVPLITIWDESQIPVEVTLIFTIMVDRASKINHLSILKIKSAWCFKTKSLMLHFYLYLFYLSEKGFLDFEKCSSSKKGSAVLFIYFSDGRISWKSFSFSRFVALGWVVTLVFTISFAPFVRVVSDFATTNSLCCVSI